MAENFNKNEVKQPVTSSWSSIYHLPSTERYDLRSDYSLQMERIPDSQKGGSFV